MLYVGLSALAGAVGFAFAMSFVGQAQAEVFSAFKHRIRITQFFILSGAPIAVVQW
jgi:hypothetical protein